MRFRILVTLAAVMLPLAARAADAAPDDVHGMEKHQISWGPVIDGMQAGLLLVEPRAVYAPGELIWQDTYLRNRGQRDLVVSAIGGYEEQGDPAITSAGGARVKVLRYFGMGLMITTTTRVPPGEVARVGRFAVAFQSTGRDGVREVAPGLSHSADGTALVLAGPGTYMLRQNIAPSIGDEKTTGKTVPTGTVPIRIAGNPVPIRTLDHNEFQDVSGAAIAWGPVKSGLQAGLIATQARDRYYVGERVRLAVILRNVSKQPITFWHQTSFAFLDPPTVAAESGGVMTPMLATESDWKALHSIKLTGVTYDMTFAPSADGPSRLRQSEISPGQSTIGYYLTAFVVPRKWPDGNAAPGRYRIVQPVRLGRDEAEQLNTSLETGALPITISDPDS